MADCDNLFELFDEELKLSDTKKGSLRTSRDSLRKKVAKKFKEKGYDVKPHEQGSFAMGTIITPLDGDFDIDDGTYMLVDEEPKETIATLHRWVKEAAKDHTGKDPIDKNPCVRVLFADGYHVDLVIYYKSENGDSFLAHKRDGWVVSNPPKFMKWFTEQTDEKGQLKRLVRYFKAWGDNLIR